MKTNMINVSVEFVIDALQARYDDVQELWGCDASASLWEQALQLVEECGLGENVTSPSIFVDNYLINGEFLTRCNFYKNDALSYGIDLEEHQLDEQGSYTELTVEQWEKVTDNALIYNDEYACIQF